MTEQGNSSVIVRMPVALHDAIKARTVYEDRSMSGLIRTVLRTYLAQPVDPAPSTPFEDA